nr:ribonuclease H-like domain-containing protein [Tanacetum cinerariifolium]
MEAPPEKTAKDKGLAGEVSSLTKKKGRIMAITVEDIQKRKNDVKARTTLLLALPDEHQLKFSKYDFSKELWEAILKTFGGNEATKKTKKNRLKQQYGNFKAEGSETLEQNFNRDDLDTMSLDDVYNHLKVYEPEIDDDDDIEEMDIKWNLALLSMRADRFWKKTGKKITIQGFDVAGFDKSKVKFFNCHKMGHFARECRSPRSQDRWKRGSYKKDP